MLLGDPPSVSARAREGFGAGAVEAGSASEGTRCPVKARSVR